MTCANCGKELGLDHRFCGYCGTAVADGADPPPQTLNSLGKKPSNNLKVLVIDDDPMFLESYLVKFENEGFNVVLAKGGREGLRSARKEDPSVILLDILMPDMSGLDVLRKLKKDKKTKGIPVVLATIVNEKTDIEQGLALGAEYYITKEAMTADDVVAKVRSAAMSARRRRDQ